MSECSNFDVIENLIEDGSATGTDWHIINNNGAFKILNNCSGEVLFSILENGYIGLGEYYTSNVIGNYSNVNFVENFTNYIDNDIINTSNYVLYRTNILELTATSNDINISNYVRSTSNTLVNYNNLTNKLVQGNGILIQEGTNIISTIQNWTNISSNDIYYNSIGNVGIGTTPASKLHVYDEKNENAKLIVQNNIVNSLDIDTTPNVSSVSIPGVIDKYLKFTYTTDTYGLLGQTQYTFTIPDNVLCDILIIGGGGAGGYSLSGGGGGAGGYVYLANVTLSQDTYIINVGKGGSAIIGNGENGYNSSLANSANVITALGGGGGAGGSVQNGRGSDGGSGGGGSVNNLLGASVYTSGGNSTQNSIYGYGNGGNGNGFLSTSNIGGGGGGASGAALSGTGANGFENSITGIPLYYAGGGGAGTSNETLYNGGLGGGGRGGNIFGFFAISGTNGYGGGGGGGGGDEGGLGEEGEGFGGDGGSGVVIIRYKRAVSHVTSFSSSIELTRGVVDDSNTDYKIGNYNGDFKIISSTTGINADALVINQNGNVGIGTITPASKLYLYDDITTATKLTIQNNITSSNAITSSSIELIRGTSNDNNPDYKIGNYDGDFKIISSTSGMNTDALVINQNGNIGIGGNVTVGNITAASFFGNGNGISGVLLTSNDTNLSNYVISTSNILVNRIRTEVGFGSNYVGRLNTNASNYVLSTSNILVDKTRTEVGFGSNYVGRLNANASNYVLSTSNILVDRIRTEVGFGSNYVGRLNTNASNYVLSTSNILVDRIMTEIGFGSNYVGRIESNANNLVLLTSNILVDRIGIEVGFGSNYSARLDANASNYVLSTNDSLINQIGTEVGFGSNYSVRLDANASNYVLSSSNILVDRIRTEVGFGSNYSVRLDSSISNYVLLTNNTLANRITNLVTDNITETTNSQNKFIVNDRYNNNLLVNGTLTINSNLIILGDSTRLETIVYTTERLEIVNENTTTVALKIQQKDIYTDIFNASNSNAIVFNIANNGDVNISGTYKKNNRDVLNDTSNYVLSTSNILVNRIKSEDIFGSNYSRRLDSNVSNYVLSTSNNLVNRIKFEDIFGSNYSARLDTNASNYVSSTSNILMNKIDSVSSKWTIADIGIYNNTANVGIGTSLPSNKLHLYNDITTATKLTIQNNIPPNNITSTPAATTTGYTNNYTYMVFTYTTDTAGLGTGQTLYTINVPTGGKICDILMVGGGGAGGKESGAGGGGGAVLYGTNITLESGAYNLKVGRGATPGEQSGGRTEGFGATILGGGSAGNISFGGPTTANSGGSGSGHKLYSDSGVGGVVVSKIGTILANAKVYNGNIGSFGQFSPSGGLYGGGGGGAGSAGKETGDGGDGVLVNITGTNYYWGGGGGGGSAFNTAKNGGLGGGGAGINYENYGEVYGTVDENSYTIPIFMNGGQHTGGGGGGGGHSSSTAGNGGSGIIIIRYLESTSTSIELTRGSITDYNTDYQIGNYNGDFKVISSTSGINTDALVINQNGNLKIGGSINATSFVGDGRGLSGLLLSSNDTNLSNYVLSTSNILVDRIRTEVGFGSNYVMSSSNILVDRIRTEVGFGSNYVLSSSNILLNRIGTEVGFGSNYVMSTSNILVDRIRTEVGFGCNYVLSSSNILVDRIRTEVGFGSNYSAMLDANISNYVLSTSNILVNRIGLGGGTGSSLQSTTLNNSIYYNTSNVGIGTSLPSNKLHLYDDVNNTTTLTIQNNNINYEAPTLTSSPEAYASGIITGSTDKFMIFTTGTTSLTIPPGGINCDILMIGGGGGDFTVSGGGGAGACIVAINQTLVEGVYSVIVGNGALGWSRNASSVGSDSAILRNENVIYLAKGGGGSIRWDGYGEAGGCGSGAGYNISLGGNPVNTNIVAGVTTGPITTSNYAVFGNKGGDQQQNGDGINTSSYNKAGGGGIGTPGGNHTGLNPPGKGGDGLYQAIINNYTYNFRNYFANGGNNFGVNDGNSNYYIGGGGGGSGPDEDGAGGLGGGSGERDVDAIPNTGSGGCGHSSGGGSGIVIIRYKGVINRSSSIELTRGYVNDSNTDYKIVNYKGDFKIISSTNGINTDALVINQSSNVAVSGNITVSSNVTVRGSVSATSFIGNGSGLTGIISSQWTTSNNNIYYNTSNVGIGTYNPASKLHIYNYTNDITSLLIQNDYNPVIIEPPTPLINSLDSGYAYAVFNYTIDNVPIENGVSTPGQTEYTFRLQKPLISALVLIVGGGGAGGQSVGGGGGGGDVFFDAMNIPAGVHKIRVGRGGVGKPYGQYSIGEQGYNSSLILEDGTTYTYCGGGAGGIWEGDMWDGSDAVASAGRTNSYSSGGGGGGGEGSYDVSQHLGGSGGLWSGKGGNGTEMRGQGGGGGSEGDGGNGSEIKSGDGGLGMTIFFPESTISSSYGGGGGGGGILSFSTLRIPGEGVDGGGNGGIGGIRGAWGIGEIGDGLPEKILAGNGINGTGGGGGGGSKSGEAGIIYEKGGNGGHGVVIIKFSSFTTTTNSTIDLVCGSKNDNKTDYKVGNYNGDFKIISSTSGINKDALVINQSSNVAVSGSISATSFIGDGRRLSGLLLTSNDANISNYVLSTSNILVDRIRTDTGFGSNYSVRLDSNISNYVLSTSNILMNRIGTGSSSQWTTSNNNIYYNTSNIGIGTSVPETKLHLYDDVANTTSLLIQNNKYIDTPVPTITPIPSVSESGTITGSTDKFMIFTSGDYNFTIPSGGINCDILMIGGGGADYSQSGGGGAGACIVAINQTLASGLYSVSIGSGAQKERTSLNGGNTTISVNSNILYRAMGGGTSVSESNNGVSGGCGSGAGYNIGSGGNPVITNVVAGVTTGPITTTTYAVLGSKGGDQLQNGSGTLFYSWASAGGGGIGTAGQDHVVNGDPGKGGDGLYQVIINSQTYNFRSYFANNTTFGVMDPDDGQYYIGGGGGGVVGGNPSAGGLGGGSGEPGVDGIANTGSGGCGNYSGGGSGIVIIRYRVLQNLSSSLELIRGKSGDSNVDYKIGNYNGDFKIISSTSGINTDALVINQGDNVTVGGSITAGSFIGDGGGLTGIISSQWTTLNNNIYYNTSNVGIGTSSPLDILHIYNLQNSNTSLLIQNDSPPAIIEPPAILINSLDSGYKYFVFNYTKDNVPLNEDGDETPGITEYTFTLLQPISAQVLIVGGGAAGGSMFGAGGGGGGVLYGSNISIPAGVHNVRVGKGGKNDTIEGTGDPGKYSSLILQDGTTYKYGGGGYGGNYYEGSSAGNSANSGAGGGGAEGGVLDADHLGSGDYANSVGAGGNGTYLGGAGGGGGIIGDGGNGSATNSGNGGQGMTIFFPESTISSSYGGGGGGFGGGGVLELPSIIIAGAGIDGGGNGATNTTFAGNGINGTGGGGGGGSYSQNGLLLSKGGTGGHGVVIIKFNTSLTNTGNAIIDLVCGSKNDSKTDYKVGNYNGGFKIISSTSGINTDALVINRSSNVTITGNVGIGTTSPSTKLHLYNDTISETKLTIQNNYTVFGFPTEIVIPNTTPGTIGTTDRYLLFPYTVDSVGLTGQTQYTFSPTEALSCDILIIGGGGGGGNGDGTSNEAGGGGAGGVVYMINKTLNIGTYKINVGKGGAANTAGSNSSITDINNINLLFDNITLIGKGGGKGATSNPNPGGDGGSGGGGGHLQTNGGTATQGNTFWNGTTYVAGGYNGGRASLSSRGGGGGGAGEIGSTDGDGYGGDGVQVSITGTNTFYAGGGNAYPYTSTTRSDGGGGTLNGTSSVQNGGNALANTGSGGSGAYGGAHTGGSGGTGIVIIRYRKLTTSSSIELLRGTVGDINVDYKIINDGTFKIISSTSGINTNALVINQSSNITVYGNVGVGLNLNPGFLLEIGAGAGTTGSLTNTYFKVSTALTTWTTAVADICSKFNSSIWTANGGSVIASSDSRIKEYIQDINDDGALQSILAIQPKTYKYIDKVIKGDNKVYGFIAQQIREVIPEATSLQKSYIPNIMLLADYITKIITLPSQPLNIIIKNDDKIKCYDKDNKEVFVEVEEVIDGLTFRIKEPEKEYTDTKIFVYGTEIYDFHTLDKNYIYTLNVCATQELHRRIEAQNITIKAQEERIKELETKMVMVLNHVSI